MISTSLTLATAALGARAHAATEPLDAFFSSSYTYCDAKLIAGLWGIDITAAKGAIGYKIQNGLETDLAGMLATARETVACEWADVPHGYTDAERLAASWGLAGPEEAKDKIAYLYTQGRSAEVVAALGSAAPVDNRGLRAFHESAYTYCDARLIAESWRVDIDEAKSIIGEKVINRHEDALADSLALARASISCTWADVPHSYADAERLARAWGLASAADAKDKVAYLYTQGRSREVLQQLSQTESAPQPQDPRALAAFERSAYTYCDAKLIGALWNIGIFEAKAEIGQKILNGYGENLPDFLVEARRRASCDFADSGLSYADAEKLASVWVVSVEQAKIKVATYYTNGQSAIVAEALAS